jgi:putative restriction endonuclease
LQFWIGITDGDWYEFLAVRRPDEVDFWQPGDQAPRRMAPGWPFLFKLHAPRHFVVGGGFFVQFTRLPCALAWDAFGENNGAASLAELIARVERYRHAPQGPGSVIGCNVLCEPFFFDPPDWIPIPANWSRNIQRGLTYDTEDQYGAALWREVMARLPRYRNDAAVTIDTDHPRYGDEYLRRARLGQGAFRSLVTDAYHRRCAVTGERTLPVLEAAHIRAHAADGPNRIDNGLLLRADIHRLFDDGYVTVDHDLRFVVSRRVREEYENGREYYRYHGRPLAHVPDAASQRPTRAFIDWHHAHCYVE